MVDKRICLCRNYVPNIEDLGKRVYVTCARESVESAPEKLLQTHLSPE